MPIRDTTHWTCEVCAAEHVQEYGAPAPGWSRVRIEHVDPSEHANIPHDRDRPEAVEPVVPTVLACHECSARIESILYPAQNTMAARAGAEVPSGNHR
jgi:hypothetical protein